MVTSGNTSSSKSFDTPVLVVGAGPVGTVLALELARHGVPCTLIERSVTPSRYPKMDYINGRTMELLRRLGLAPEIRAGGVPPEHSFNFIWSRDFDEPPVAVWQYASPADVARRIEAVDDGSAPLEPYLRMQGSLLEEVLREQARRHRLVDMREGWRFLSLHEDDEKVNTFVVDTTTDTVHTIRAQFLAACDGANSAVRRSLGVPVQRVAPPTRHCDVYFRSGDPTLRRHGRAFLTIAARGLTLVSRDEADTWTGTFMLTDEASEAADPVATMRAKLGAEFTVDEVLNVAYWEGALAVAAWYRQGSTFLLGDAAHQFYPVGGHGANTGVADAVDLGWKLSAVVNGWGGPRLLDSYEVERRPVALFNREMCANLLEVWRRFSQLVAEGASREHVAGFLEQETYQLDNVGIHFGYRYSGSPVVWDEDGVPPPWDWRSIVPTTWPGCRPPAMRLSDGSALFDHFGTGFTLVDLSGAGAGERMAKEADRRALPVSYLAVNEERVRNAWERELVLVRPDQHVVWRGNAVPEDCDAVFDRACGR